MKTIRVHFDGKVLVPEEPVDLPVGQSLEVRVGEAAVEEESPVTEPTLARLARWAQTLPPLTDSPGDAAAQHDHYLYGTPKRENP